MKLKLPKFPNLNPFADAFREARSERDQKIQQQVTSNAQGISQDDIAQQSIGGQPSYTANDGQVMITAMQFEQFFNSKKQKIQKYREMAQYPVVKQSTEHVCDDAIVPDINNNIVHLNFNEEIPENWEKKIRREFEYFVDNVINFNENAWDLFNRFLIDAELYGELVLNDTKDSIIGIKMLPPFTITPVYFNGEIIGFSQIPEKSAINWAPKKKDQIDFDRDQIAYVDYFDRGIDINDVRGYYEPAIKSYNQLKSMEDAVLVARLARAPLRRSWSVDVGRMTKPNAESYMKGLIQRFRKRMFYDPSSGMVNSSENHIAMTEDYWFAKTADGKGTTMDHIDSGLAGLGELEDVGLFRNNLYMALKMPRSRYDSEALYNAGRSGEITREEIKLARFINRLKRRFSYFIYDPFITQLRLRGFPEEYCRYDLYNIYLTESNLFKEYKEIEILDARLSTLSTISPYIYSPNDNPDGFFDPEFVLQEYFMMPDDLFDKNKRMLRARKFADKLADQVPEEGGSGGMGGSMGGGSLEGPEDPSPELGEPDEGVGEGGGEEGPADDETPEEILQASTQHDDIIYPTKVKPMEKFSIFKSWRKEDMELAKSKTMGPVLNEGIIGGAMALISAAKAVSQLKQEMTDPAVLSGKPGGEVMILDDLEEIGVDDIDRKSYKINLDSETSAEYSVLTGVYDEPRYVLDQLLRKGYEIHRSILRGQTMDSVILTKDGHFYEFTGNKDPYKVDGKYNKYRDQSHIEIQTITNIYDREDGGQRQKGGLRPDNYNFEERL